MTTKPAKKYLEAAIKQQKTKMMVWNDITTLPKIVKNPERQQKLEELGFKILEWELMARN